MAIRTVMAAGAGNYLGAVAGGRIYQPAGRIYAIDAVTEYSMGRSVAEDRQTLVFELPQTSLVVAGYSVSTAPNSGGVIALNAKTGVERWQSAFPRRPTRRLAAIRPALLCRRSVRRERVWCDLRLRSLPDRCAGLFPRSTVCLPRISYRRIRLSSLREPVEPFCRFGHGVRDLQP
jgi:hypothetical protein